MVTNHATPSADSILILESVGPDKYRLSHNDRPASYSGPANTLPCVVEVLVGALAPGISQFYVKPQCPVAAQHLQEAMPAKQLDIKTLEGRTIRVSRD